MLIILFLIYKCDQFLVDLSGALLMFSPPKVLRLNYNFKQNIFRQWTTEIEKLKNY